MTRCALCGRYLRMANTGAGYVKYCAGCGYEWPAEIEGYDERYEYTTPDGRFQFVYRWDTYWYRFDMLNGDLETVSEEDLPGHLILLSDWQASQREAQAVAALYGEVAQMPLFDNLLSKGA